MGEPAQVREASWCNSPLRQASNRYGTQLSYYQLHPCYLNASAIIYRTDVRVRIFTSYVTCDVRREGLSVEFAWCLKSLVNTARVSLGVGWGWGLGVGWGASAGGGVGWGLLALGSWGDYHPLPTDVLTDTE